MLEVYTHTRVRVSTLFFLFTMFRCETCNDISVYSAWVIAEYKVDKGFFTLFFFY